MRTHVPIRDRRCADDNLFIFGGARRSAAYPCAMPAAAAPSFDEIPLSDFPMSTTAYAVLQAYGIATVGALRQCSRRDLSAIAGLPEGALAEIVAGLESCGLELAPETAPRSLSSAVSARLGAGARWRHGVSIVTISTALALVFDELLEVALSLP